MFPEDADADARRRARLQRRQSAGGDRASTTRTSPNPQQGRAAADHPRSRAEGLVQGPAAAARRRPGRSGAIRWARSTRAPIRRTCRRTDQAAWPAAASRILGGGDYGTAYVERGEIYDLVRDAKITGFAIVSGDRHSFWAGYAATALPPGKFEPVGLSFVGASLSSPGAMEAYEHRLPKDHPLRPLFLADRPDGAKPDWTFNMLLRHGVRSCLEYAKSFDLERSARALQPGARAAPRVRRHGRTRLCDGAAHRRRDADRVRLHPAPDHAQRAPRRRAAALSRAIDQRLDPRPIIRLIGQELGPITRRRAFHDLYPRLGLGRFPNQ